MTPPIPFKFSLRPGDLINAMAGIKHACEVQQKRAVIYLGLNIEWKTTPDMQVGRSNSYTMTEETMESLKPLLLSQPYIQGVFSLEEKFPEIYHGWCDLINSPHPTLIKDWYQKHLIIDLDKSHLMPIGLPAGNLFRMNFYTYPDMACDLSDPWIDVDPVFAIHRPIVINRTARARNTIDYKFLRELSPLIFIGLWEEYKQFREEVGFEPQYVPTNNILDLARVIKSARFFVGNQSLAFSLAEAMKVPRVLEICPSLPNVIPSGRYAYDCYFQQPFQYYVNYLNSL